MKIAFQGAFGAYSDIAARQIFADSQTVPCKTFEGAFTAVSDGYVDRAVIPIDNTLAGRVADVHHLLPQSDLFIVGEHFLPIRHCLLGLSGARKDILSKVHSHTHAIPQCRQFFRGHPDIEAVVHADTAGAAADIARHKKEGEAAIASELAADIYGLDIIERDLQDDDTNTTRFIVLSKQRDDVDPAISDTMTSFVFQVRNIPAALYKALGGFATNNVNMMKLESYVDNKFQAAQFYAEVNGHALHDNVQRAIDELSFFAKDIQILGSYKQSPFRKELGQS